MNVKQLETTEKVIGETTFYIRPFPAFVAAGISGDLAAVATPLLGVLAAANGVDTDSIMDMDAEKVIASLGNSISALSGDKIESLLYKLLIKHENISVSGPATEGETKRLNMDLANEVFCGEVQDMYVLCFEVIRLNFKGFFKKLGSRFGNLQGVLEKVKPSLKGTENLT